MDENGVESIEELHFFYDAQNRPAMVEFNGVIYTYAHNYQGDISAILDSAGAIVVEYYYDAWGRQYSVTGSMKDTLGKLNPFRYRGYVYDEETSLYYLRSRYYNSLRCRFINADTVLGRVGVLGSHNLFAYCVNSPVQFSDPTGFLLAYSAGGIGVPTHSFYESMLKAGIPITRRVQETKTYLDGSTEITKYIMTNLSDINRWWIVFLWSIGRFLFACFMSMGLLNSMSDCMENYRKAFAGPAELYRKCRSGFVGCCFMGRYWPYRWISCAE